MKGNDNFLPVHPLFRELEIDERWFKEIPVIDVGSRKNQRLIYLPGSPADCFLIVLKGIVMTGATLEDGREMITNVHGPADVFGEMDFLHRKNGMTRGEFARVNEPATIARISRNHLTMLDKKATIYYRLIQQVLLPRQIELRKMLPLMSIKSVTQRLAWWLLRLGQKFGVEEDRGLLIGVKFTQTNLAAMVGSNRETINLTISRLRRTGLIEITGERKLVLLDLEGLRELISQY